MAEVTDADRRLAANLAAEATFDTDWGARLIAGVLARERELARAPFLALADEYERDADMMHISIGQLVVTKEQAFYDAADSIRRASKVLASEDARSDADPGRGDDRLRGGPDRCGRPGCGALPAGEAPAAAGPDS